MKKSLLSPDEKVMKIRYVDVHAHMNEEIFDRDRKKILDECKEQGILVIDCAGKPDGNRKLLKLTKQFSNLKACLGIYPVDIVNMTDKQFYDELKFIEKNGDKLIGIGEVGLDFYWIKDDAKRRLQVDRFKELVWLANKLKLPLNVHTRDAEKETIAILVRSAHVPVVLHAYGGELEEAQFAIQQGFFFSINPNVVYNQKRQKLVEFLPMANILTETDSPYLGPTKERNDPRNIPLTVRKIAEIKKMNEEEIRKQIIENAKKVFKI